MAALLPPFFLAAGLLVVSGAGKWLRPHVSGDALHAAGLPGGVGAVRALALMEVLVGCWCLAAPTPAAAAALTVVYIGLAAFVVRLLVPGSGARSCGCFGRTEAPPSWLHVFVDLGAAGLGLAAAVGGSRLRGLVPVTAHLGPAGVGFVMGLVAAVYLTVALVELVPSLFGAFITEPER